jgi:hypothetical protein
MYRPTQELTLGNVLTDPMVRIAMKADGVDPHELAAMLASVAAKLGRTQAKPYQPCACAA